MLVDLRRFVLLCAVLLTAAACTSATSHRAAPSAVPSAPTPTLSTLSPKPKPTPKPTPKPKKPTPTHRLATRHATPTAARPPATTPRPAPPRAAPPGLPLPYTTGGATRVITVVAPSTGSTTATLQAWQKSGQGWTRYGAPTMAYLGTAGLSAHPSESQSATPIGSFTLTEAFGRQVNPGTGLPYRQTTPADWWISQPGSLYNTLQHCASSCAFSQGDPNEHLYYETPYYNYAVVIDYNRSPVVQGAGSAFFLHVAVGAPTQGCVAIQEAILVSIMRWLTPASHPRILIGVG